MELDRQQILAVKSSSQQVLCLAAAGSGKTRVLTERIAWLIEHRKVSPSEILCLTFTRKAAGEMKTRLEDRIGRKSYGITMGTIHSIALGFLKRFGELAGLRGRNLTVYGEWEADYLLREVATDLGIYNGKAWKIPKKDVDRVFDLYYQEGKPPEETDPVYPLFQDFNARCRENNALTYGGLLIAFRNLLVMIRNYLRFKHILIDEIQDIDALQWDIINRIKTLCEASVFAVGDIDQSIFEWRGACPGYLVEHQGEFDIYRLESNYRSTLPLVRAANNLIGHNEKRIPRTMWATREWDGNQTTIEWTGADSAKTSQGIRGYLLIHEQDPSDIGILARNHFLLDKLADELDALGVPAVKIGKTAVLTNSPEFRRFHAFLKLLVNPYDNFSFLLIWDLIGLSRQEYNEIRLQATREGRSDFQTWIEGAWGNEEVKISFFNEPLVESLGAAAFAIKYMASGALPFDGPKWSFDVGDCFQFVMGWLIDNPLGTIKEYLDWLATYDIQDEIREEEGEGKVKLMTIHSAKGLEWPVVIVAGCNEGLLPSKQAIDSSEIEQERRLMYVAMTRARDKLILAIRPERKEGPGGRVYENPRSRFVGEMIDRLEGIWQPQR